MNLYRIAQEANNDYDTYDSAVVVAVDEENAREMDPSGGVMDWTKIRHRSDWASQRDQVTVEYLGVADARYTEPCVVCASYHAG